MLEKEYFTKDGIIETLKKGRRLQRGQLRWSI